MPLYILIANKLHMTNTYAAMILPGVVTSYNIFLAKQFFTSIPTPLIESEAETYVDEFVYLPVDEVETLFIVGAVLSTLN